jgi:phosphatidylserine/phosphatidylglycerophosphate/cardiolipin synthase-like enzyme
MRGGRLGVIGLVVCVATVASGCAAPTKKSSPNGTITAVPIGRPTTSIGATTSSEPATTTSTTSTHAPPGLSLLVEPEDGMAPIDDFMSSARQSLDMTMYELSDTTAEHILISDHNRGVKVRVLLDRDFSGLSVNQAAYSTLSAAGVAVAWANNSEIFHQKTITVDDAESAIMTGNLTPQYYSTTRDFVVMDGQTPDVSAIESTFSSDWSGAAPSPGPDGADLVWSPGSTTQLVALIDSANRNLTVENEEMDSAAVEAALKADAQRGVNVTVIMTSDSEWDTAFSQLESAGVHVVLYPDTSSALYIHAKVIDVDSTKAFIGSENFSTASLGYNRELGVITTSTDVLGPLNDTLLSDSSGGQQQGPATPPPSSVPASTPSTTAGSSGCYPIDNEGGCYEPGEYCRDDDHGMTGRAGNGEAIICEDDDGWYWKAA